MNSFFCAQNRTRSACGASADLSAVGCRLLRKYSCLLCDVAKSKFLPHRSSIPTIFNCNNLPSVRSRLLPPVESGGGGFSVFRTPKVVKAQT